MKNQENVTQLLKQAVSEQTGIECRFSTKSKPIQLENEQINKNEQESFETHAKYILCNEFNIQSIEKDCHGFQVVICTRYVNFFRMIGHFDRSPEMLCDLPN